VPGLVLFCCLELDPLGNGVLPPKLQKLGLELGYPPRRLALGQSVVDDHTYRPQGELGPCLSVAGQKNMRFFLGAARLRKPPWRKGVSI